MDSESGPIRCDSSLSVVKIQPVNDGQKGKRLLARHKFSDPEIEELYQLHSANQKRTELFRCFLYCILFYSIVHIIVYAAWIGRNPVVFGGEDTHERFHHHHSVDSHGIPTTSYSDAETPETMTLNTYASMLETSHSGLQKSVFHVEETSDILQYSVLKNHEKTNQYPFGTTTTGNNTGKKIMSSATNSHLVRPKSGTPTSVMMNHTPLPLQPPPSLHNLGESISTNNNNRRVQERKGRSSALPIIASATSASEEGRRGNAIHFHLVPPPPPPHQTHQQPQSSSLPYNEHLLGREHHQHRDKEGKRATHTDEGKGANLSYPDDNGEEEPDGSENKDDEEKATRSSAQDDKKLTRSRAGLSRLRFNKFIDVSSSDPSGSIQSNDGARSSAWFPYAARTNFHFRGRRSLVTRGVHRFGSSNKEESDNNQNHHLNDEEDDDDEQQREHKLGPPVSPSSTQSSSTMSGGGGGGGESRESRDNKLNFKAKAYAYTRLESEFNSHTDPNPGNLYFVLVLLCLLIACVFVASFMLLPFRRCPRNHHIPVIIWSAAILCSVVCNTEAAVNPRLAFGWILLETFLVWVTLPLRMRTALFYTASLAMLYIIVTSVRERNRPYLGRQIGADIIMIVITNILGMLEFYLSDKKQRRAFIDTRQSLEMKLVIEEQAKEQERLLLSVLPEHLALKMRQDLGEATDGQFKKIYMSRHENVSILYADIVGFTAISSTYSASELVKILNELFATFDKLAEKHNQIRIKILGDCYYCICGAPEEREDHAILCVHMGLSMVKAIKYVREKTKSSVDMRVGIHTGAILAGILGQRQWQYDIYSKDVELANKMESSGKPGRVHISEVTLSFLNESFEVEPAHGEKREEILRIAGIKTYFIVRPIKPFRESCTGATENGNVPPDDTMITKDLPSDLHSTFAEDSNSAIDESHVHGKQTELEAYRLRLKEELLSRDGYKDLSRQCQWLTLSFRDPAKESEFTKHKDPYAGIYYGACPIALVAVALSAFSVVSFTVVGLVVLLVGLLFLALITTFSACETSPMKSRLKKMSGIIESFCSLESELWVRRLVSVFGALVLTAANLAFLIPCLESKECSTHITDEVEDPLVLPNLASRIPGQHDDCRLPAFFIPFATVILFSITLLNYLGFWLKSLIIFAILLLHIVLMLSTSLKAEMECSERLLDNDEYWLIPVYCYLALFAAVAFAGLFSLNRRLEKSARVLFLWKTEVEYQRETATQLRQKNEALVYNILPPHVATHFLGSRRRKHEELYSQSYSEVGILFASMPNFSDFYTEETVNNQGLECLRFLNEVISDYDALLELPKFNDNIIKIKTISSTYMAASGLSPSSQAKPEDPDKTRWLHLSLLVEFAFELKRALTSINEQSFNHFVLKMGINHGPITAGVIGARKPHYDIWGNSVNVASRMESTGKAGCIQVTESTHRILRLYGYQFEQRGLVNVKGKGQLMTYYLIGRGPEPSEQEVQKMLSEPETDGNTVTQ